MVWAGVGVGVGVLCREEEVEEEGESVSESSSSAYAPLVIRMTPLTSLATPVFNGRRETMKRAWCARAIIMDAWLVSSGVAAAEVSSAAVL